MLGIIKSDVLLFDPRIFSILQFCSMTGGWRTVKEDGQAAPSIDDFLPSRTRVEETLGTSLVPSGGAYEFVHDPTRPDIRIIVHDLVAQVVQYGETATGQQLRHAEREDLITQARRQIIIANNVAIKKN